MARPSKPVEMLLGHKTKAEIESRKKAESAMLSGKPLYERTAVKKDKIAHKEFLRVTELMKKIGKNDALYSSGINTYCQLFSEVSKLEDDRLHIDVLIMKMESKFEELENIDFDQQIEFSKQINKLFAQKRSIGGDIDGKRKLMLSIDKENVMTISAALRSIPKTPEKVENPLLKALSGDDNEE